MAEIASAYVTLIPSLKGSSGTIAKELGGAGKSGGAAASKGFKGSFLSGVKSLAGPVAGLIGISAGVNFLKDANAEAREAQKVGALTESIIKSTGGSAKVTAEQIGDLSSAISAKVGMDDEAIQSGANMLLTFKEIRNEVGKGRDIFNRATQAATDLSAAGFGDLTGQAKMLGKALNDPTKGMAALSRSGVTFTDQQKAMVEALQKGGMDKALAAMGYSIKNSDIEKAMTDKGIGVMAAIDELTGGLDKAEKKQFEFLSSGGHMVKAQQIILKEVESQVGGAAEATATSGEKMSVAFGNLKEQVGTALLPVVDGFATKMTADVIPAISGFISGITDGTGAGGKFADMVGAMGGALSTAAGFIKDHGTAVAALVGIYAAWKIAQVGAAAAQAVSLALLMAQTPGTAAHAVASIAAATASGAWTAAQWLLNAALTANPIGIVVVAIAALVAGFVLAWKKSETFRNAVKTLAIGFIELGKFGVMAFRLLLTAAFATFDGILSAAEKGLGWIPGIGPKISAAREAFGRFGDATISKLQGVEARLTGVQQKIAGIPESKTFTLNIQTIKSATAKNEAMLDGVRALGGPVRGGGTYLVGERGPELFTPRTSGAIIPNSATVGAVGVAGSGPRTVRLVVRDREFEAYMDERADSRIDANGRHPIGRRR